VRWRRSPHVLWRTAPGYLALATVDGHTVEVDGPGCDVWTRLAGWIRDDELAAALARQYGAEERVVSLDVRSLLQDLHAQGYVERDE
jgi:Coenzyme PQQ synthesis protein D (PqqD)